MVHITPIFYQRKITLSGYYQYKWRAVCNPQMTFWPSRSEGALPPYLLQSIHRHYHQVTGIEQSSIKWNWPEEKVWEFNGDASCDDASTLLSKTWQSVEQNPIKVESRRQWPHWFRGQIRNSKTEGLKPGCVWRRNKLPLDYWQERCRFSYDCFGDGRWTSLFRLCHYWVKTNVRKQICKPSDRGGRNSIDKQLSSKTL